MTLIIFDIPQYVQLILPSSGSPVGTILSNPPMSSKTHFNVYLGVTNNIQFMIRDVDRKFINTSAYTLMINITDDRSQNLLLARNLTVYDVPTGTYQLTLTPLDTLTWDIGFLKWSVTATDASGNVTILFTDRDYNAFSYMNVINGPQPVPAPPITLDPSTFIIQDGFCYSSPLSAPFQYQVAGTTQTFVFNTTAYSGVVTVQGSLLSQPSTDAPDWFQAASMTIASATGATYLNVPGSYMWLRVVIQSSEFPLPYPASMTPIMPASGVLNSILYKT